MQDIGEWNWAFVSLAVYGLKPAMQTLNLATFTSLNFSIIFRQAEIEDIQTRTDTFSWDHADIALDKQHFYRV